MKEVIAMTTPPPMRTTAPASVLIASWGILVTAIGTTALLLVTRNTGISDEAIASLAVAVIGVAGVHLGHVSGHQQANYWRRVRTHGSAVAGFVVIGLALVGGLWAITRAATDSGLSAEAIAALAAAVIGVAGTHIGHVTGYQLGRPPSGGAPIAGTENRR